jgi:carboxyl-terminal processing protease
VRLEDFLTRADQYEQKRLWQQAVDVYERALRLYPAETSLKQRYEKVERLHSLSRRYHDASFLGELLRLSQSDALQLYRQLLQKIETHYVEPVAIGALVRHGYRALDLALAERQFVTTNFAASVPEELEGLRQELAVRAGGDWRSADSARGELVELCQICRRYGLRNPTAIVLEFCAAACERLDPYSAHLTPNRLKDLYAMIDGNFVGLGIEVKGDELGLEILQVLPNSPASEAELSEGETIVAIDGVPIVDHADDDAANRLRGPDGSTIRLEVRGKPKRGGTRTVWLTRREVLVQSVMGTCILDAARGIGYVRLGSFQKQTVEELQQAVAALEQAGLRSLIVDLRDNPGGLLDVAVVAANRFIDRGVIVTTKGRAWGQSVVHSARPIEAWRFPLVVLVDGESASASEIFAGAIQDHRRGMIVGTKTFGKGSVQSIFPLSTTATALRLTTARFYSPNGRTYEGQGVTPDLVVSRPTGPLGEELPVPRNLYLAGDEQLRAACRLLQSQR